MNEIDEWLTSLGFGQYADAFEANQIEWSMLPDLDHELLKEIGVEAVGHRIGILKAIQALGSPLGSPSSPATEQPSLPRSRSPTPPPASGAAERRQLTVMFADLAGSTALSQELDAEDLRDINRAYQEAARGAIEAGGGYVARYMGDGVLAYFGYPRAHEDDAERAVRAGLELVASVRRLPVEPPLAVRVGIATGPVVVGDIIGEGAAEEAAVVGETPNLAARLQGVAGENSVVISETTSSLVSGLFIIEPSEPRSLKGFREPVTPYLVRGEHRGEARFSTRSQRRLGAFVGRTEELGILGTRWDRACQGQGQVVLLVGQAGIGKSRLLREFRWSPATAPAHYLRIQCSPYYESSALHPVIAGLEYSLGWLATTENHARLDGLRRKLAELGDTDEGTVGLLAQLLSISSKGQFPELESLDAQVRRDRTLNALARYTLLHAGFGPTLVAFEDVHWADPTTRELLRRLAEAVRQCPALLVATSRPGFDSDWTDLPHATVMSLSRMTAQDSEQLVRGTAANVNLPPDTVGEILTRADGNPLYLEELARNYERSGGDARVPATLHDLLMASLDASGDGKAVAQCAAVIGRAFGSGLLRRVWTGTDERLERGLDALVSSGLVHRRGSEGSEEYVFKHALVRDVAYATLLRDDRRNMHGCVVQALESEGTGAASQDPALLALHHAAAGVPERALPFWGDAAARSIRLGALEEAMSHLRRGIEAASGVAGIDSAKQGIRFRVTLAECLRTVERSDDAFATLNEAEALATEFGLDEELARTHHMLGNLFFPKGEVERCLEHHGRALEHARRAGATDAEALSLGGLGDGHYMEGALHTAWRNYVDCVSICRDQELGAVEAAHLSNLAVCELYFLRISDALACTTRTLDLAATTGHMRAEVLAYTVAALIHIERADYEAAQRSAERGIEVAAAIGAKRFLPALLTRIGRARHCQGDEQEAKSALDEALQRAREADAMAFIGPVVLGNLLLVTDDGKRRERYREEGAEILTRSRLCHSYLGFYRDAAESALIRSEWSSVPTFVRALRDYGADGSLPWAELFASRATALTALGQSRSDGAAIRELQRLRDVVRRADLNHALPLMDAALESA